MKSSQQPNKSSSGLHTAVSLATRIVKHRKEYLRDFGVDLEFEDAEYCHITMAILGRMGFAARHIKKMMNFVPEEGGPPPSGHIIHAIELIDGESRLLMGPHGAFKEAHIIEELSETLFPGEPVQPYRVYGGWVAETGVFLNPSKATTRFILAAIEKGVAFLQAQDLKYQTAPVARMHKSRRL